MYNTWCRIDGSHPATWTWSHRSGICLKDLDLSETLSERSRYIWKILDLSEISWYIWKILIYLKDLDLSVRSWSIWKILIDLKDLWIYLKDLYLSERFRSWIGNRWCVRGVQRTDCFTAKKYATLIPSSLSQKKWLPCYVKGE